MKKSSLMFGILLAVILLVGWRPFPQESGLLSGIAAEQQALAGASDPELTINNQTGAAFYVTLAGPASYSFQVVPGKNTFVVVKGEYTLSYFACGAQQTKTVNVKKSGASIKLLCETPKAGKTPVLTIDNKTGPVYVTLTGPKTYSFYAPAGKTDFPVEKGEYEVSYYACGAQTEITFNVKKKGGTLKILCLEITFLNLNDTVAVNLELHGPADYYFYLPPGKTTVLLAPGVYDYEVSGACSSFTGTIAIKKKGTYYVFCF